MTEIGIIVLKMLKKIRKLKDWNAKNAFQIATFSELQLYSSILLTIILCKIVYCVNNQDLMNKV